MRIAIHLDDPSYPSPSPYAVLWLETSLLTWLREGYVGLDLPEAGILQVEPDRTFVRSAHHSSPWCVLEGLSLDGSIRARLGDAGRAHWCGSADLPPLQGHWVVKRSDSHDRRPRGSARSLYVGST
ncbi:DUF3564 family protein [Trinickia sp.]|uniref:DUF3564 family protein n=1 Tax=Trinickia sp. TaxID=2571163 RepID=UPI0039C95046